MKKVLALLIASILVATAAGAYYYTPYAPYGSSSSEYSHTWSREDISVSENEYARTSSYNAPVYWHPRQYRASQTYNYGRSREFEFSREYENTYERRDDSYAYPYYPRITGHYDYGRFAYPYYQGSQYRDYYEYDTPYRNSRFANYYGYVPYGY